MTLVERQLEVSVKLPNSQFYGSVIVFVGLYN